MYLPHCERINLRTLPDVIMKKKNLISKRTVISAVHVSTDSMGFNVHLLHKFHKRNHNGLYFPHSWTCRVLNMVARSTCALVGRVDFLTAMTSTARHHRGWGWHFGLYVAMPLCLKKGILTFLHCRDGIRLQTYAKHCCIPAMIRGSHREKCC